MRKKNESLPAITDAEWILMRILWEHGPATANEVVAALEGDRDWKPKTIQTLLRRLTDKGALRVEKSGREYIFHPMVDREAAERAQSHSLIDRVFDGQAVPFLARFLESQELSAEDIRELKSILNRKSR